MVTQQKKEILFRLGGGLGKQIMGTAVAQAIKDAHPDSVLHVQTSYPRAFQGLDFVDRLYPGMPLPYFKEEHDGFEIIAPEPYLHLGYREKKVHLIKAWCEMAGVKPPEEIRGIIRLNSHEIALAKQRMGVPEGKKVIAFQPWGGTAYTQAQEANDPTRIKHTRDLPFETAQKIVVGLVKAGYIVVQISLPTERRLEGAIPLEQITGRVDVQDPRHVFAVLSACHGFLGIDSFGVHAWNALGKKAAVVLWGGTSSSVLGYPTDKNLTHETKCPTPHCHRPDAALGDVIGDGITWTCPRDNECMSFDAERVVREVIKSYPMATPAQVPAQEAAA
jgi:ADP-heptose:LPS heptosyltransferase